MNNNQIITGFYGSGFHKVNIPLVKNKWSHLWFIVKEDNQFRLIKKYRKSSNNYSFNTRITEEQARELIDLIPLNLESDIMNDIIVWSKLHKEL